MTDLTQSYRENHQYNSCQKGPGAIGALVWHRALVLLALWSDRARQRRALDRLDDRLLRDIGVTRIEVDAESRRLAWYR